MRLMTQHVPQSAAVIPFSRLAILLVAVVSGAGNTRLRVGVNDVDLDERKQSTHGLIPTRLIVLVGVNRSGEGVWTRVLLSA